MTELTVYPLIVNNKKKGAIKIDEEKMPFQVWKAAPMPPNSDENYFYTTFAMLMNNFPDKLKNKVSPNDSRRRPDQRYLEEGDIEKATEYKDLLEIKQRDKAKWRQENPNNEFVPRYFEKLRCPESGEEYYAYGTKRDYWEDRKNQEWEGMEDIF